jgi:hypothetical protein
MNQDGTPKNITLLGAMNPFTTQGCLIGQGVLLIGSYKFFGWAVPNMWDRLAAGSKALLEKFSGTGGAFEFKGAGTIFKEVGKDGAKKTYNVSEVLAQRIRSKAMAQLGDAPDIARVGMNSTIEFDDNGKPVDLLKGKIDSWMETHFTKGAKDAMKAADMQKLMKGLLDEKGGEEDIIGKMSSKISQRIAENAKNAGMDGAEDLANKLSSEADAAGEAAAKVVQDLGGAESAAGEAADAFFNIIKDFLKP